VAKIQPTSQTWTWTPGRLWLLRLSRLSRLNILNNELAGYVKAGEMFTLLKLELEKLLRARSFYLSFIVLIGFVALMLWGF